MDEQTTAPGSEPTETTAAALAVAVPVVEQASGEIVAPIAAVPKLLHPATETYAVVEIYGHRRHAGRISEVLVAGREMLRIDVPQGGSWEAVETFEYGGGAIFSIRRCTRAQAEEANARPRFDSSYDPPEFDD